MFDLTKKIKLEGNWQKRYRIIQLIIYLFFLSGAFYVAYLFLFPSQKFYFFFRTPQATKNTIIKPRTGDGKNIQKGEIAKEKTMTFDAPFVNDPGNFSVTNIVLAPEKNSSSFLKGKISARKSFQAFFYPLGDPMGFKNGSLLLSDGSFYIVSDDKLKKFSSAQIMRALGYNQENFLSVLKEDLVYNQMGENLTDAQNYPEDALFKIEENYYQLKKGVLHKFVSPAAFLAGYETSQAVEKPKQFLESYAISEDLIGFPSGTLLSSVQAVYIVNGGKISPIGDEIIFAAMGFDWSDVIPAEEELGIYEKTKVFTASNPHPDGIIFCDKDSGRYYIVDNGARREIKSENILKSYLRSNPIIVDLKSLDASISCDIKKISAVFSKYGCTLPIESINKFSGNDFQFEITLDNAARLNTLDATFSKSLNWKSFRSTLSDIKKKLLMQYGGQ